LNFHLFSSLKKSFQKHLVPYPSKTFIPSSIREDVEISYSRVSHRNDSLSFLRFWKYFEELNLPSQKQNKNNTEKEENHIFYTENDAALDIENFRKNSENYLFPSFPTISAFGGNGAIVHYRAPEIGSSQILSNRPLLIDTGGQYLLGTTDITRVICNFSPNSKKSLNNTYKDTQKIDDLHENSVFSMEFKIDYTLVLITQLYYFINSFDPDTSLVEVSKKARAIMGHFGRSYGHGTGHGIGALGDVHEGPFGIETNLKIERNVILSNEPGIYKEKKYGIRLENDMVSEIKNGKLMFENLTLIPYERKFIVEELLSEECKEWLNEFYSKIREEFEYLEKDDNELWKFIISKTEMF